MAGVGVRHEEAASSVGSQLPLDVPQPEVRCSQGFSDAWKDAVQTPLEHVPDFFETSAHQRARTPGTVVERVLASLPDDARFSELPLAGDRVLEQALMFVRGEEVH